MRRAAPTDPIAQLAHGVAHDIDNLLTIVMVNLGYLEGESGLSAECREAARIALSAARRGAHLSERLRAFPRAEDLKPTVVHVSNLLTDVRIRWEKSCGSGIAVESTCATDVWDIAADPNELSYALERLADNARAAMPKSGAKLAIRATNRRCDVNAGTALDANRRALGDYVLLAVTDNGSGMSAETLAHVFEPFYSTKDPGTGQGLGLSHVHGFAQHSGGHIEILSEIGRGTTVQLYMPRAEQVGVEPDTRDGADVG